MITIFILMLLVLFIATSVLFYLGIKELNLFFNSNGTINDYSLLNGIMFRFFGILMLILFIIICYI